MENWIKEYVGSLGKAEYNFHILLTTMLLVFLLYKSYKTFRLYRYIKDTATSKIASAAQGYVELKGLGELMPGPVITSPFSQRRCLWYHCIVEKRKAVDKQVYWQEESNEISDHLFLLQDETGSCVIIPNAAEVFPSQQNRWYGNTVYAKHQNHASRGWITRFISFGQYRFSEKLIAVADSLYVSGLFISETKLVNKESEQQEVNSLLKKWKSKPQKYLKMFDLEMNGKFQHQEWKKIFLYARQQVQSRRQQTDYHVVKKPVEKNHPFVISARSEQHLLKSNRWRVSAYLLLFFMLLYFLQTAVTYN